MTTTTTTSTTTAEPATPILTKIRNAVWDSLDNWPALSGVFTTKYASNAQVEAFELKGVVQADLPAVAIRWAEFEPTWRVNQNQTWPVGFTIESYWCLGSLSTVERRVQEIQEAIGSSGTGGVSYLKLATGYHASQWGPVSIRAEEVADGMVWVAQQTFVQYHNHNPLTA